MGAADTVGYPILIKPNVGGSGAGIARYDSKDELQVAVDACSIELGIDGTGLVQQLISSADDNIYRVEMLGSQFLYATSQPLRSDAFNYCAIDGGGPDQPEAEIRLLQLDSDRVAQAATIMEAARADVGSVEYLIDSATGEPCFFDFNPYSNLLEGFDDKLGFSPIERYVDHVLGTCR